jgi:hypothetical protein
MPTLHQSPQELQRRSLAALKNQEDFDEVNAAADDR